MQITQILCPADFSAVSEHALDHGRTALDLLLFGSTTHHVIRAATCPVLIVRRG